MPQSTQALPDADRRPKVGVGVFVVNQDGHFLMGKRKGSNGAGTYALPGGHLEFQESFEDCAARELEEETGLRVQSSDVRFLTATNNILHQDSGKHYVTIFMSVRAPEDQEPQNLEPEKCEGWEWLSWEQLLYWIEQQRQASQASTSSKAALETNQDRCAGTKKLFPPMITLVKTRPGLRPDQVLP